MSFVKRISAYLPDLPRRGVVVCGRPRIHTRREHKICDSQAGYPYSHAGSLVMVRGEGQIEVKVKVRDKVRVTLRVKARGNVRVQACCWCAAPSAACGLYGCAAERRRSSLEDKDWGSS